MKLIFPILFLLSLIFSSDQIPAPDQDHPILIKGGTIHTVSHGTLGNADILFDNGKIISVGNELIVPVETVSVRLTGPGAYEVNGFMTVFMEHVTSSFTVPRWS